MPVNFSVDDCFYQLKSKSKNRKQILDYCLAQTDWTTAAENGRYSFYQIKLPKELYSDDPVLSYYGQQAGVVRVFKMLANTYYALHVDSYRAVSFNMLLNDSCNSTTFFDVGKCGGFRRHQFNVYNLAYEPDCYYLLNTQIRHAVINLNQDRYLLSIGLGHIKKPQTDDPISLFNEQVNIAKTEGL